MCPEGKAGAWTPERAPGRIPARRSLGRGRATAPAPGSSRAVSRGSGRPHRPGPGTPTAPATDSAALCLHPRTWALPTFKANADINVTGLGRGASLGFVKFVRKHTNETQLPSVVYLTRNVWSGAVRPESQVHRSGGAETRNFSLRFPTFPATAVCDRTAHGSGSDAGGLTARLASPPALGFDGSLGTAPITEQGPARAGQ